MTWEPRGKDTNGENTLVGVTMGRTYLITESPAHGVRLWLVNGSTKAMQGRFVSVPEAQDYADGVDA